MISIILVFADGDSRRDFNSTFDAYVEILNAFNMCEEYFIGARFADDKEGKYINILNAEAYIGQVGPVKDYLEHAVLAGFENGQICEDISRMYFIDVPKVLPSWRQHMKEYSDLYEDYINGINPNE